MISQSQCNKKAVRLKLQCKLQIILQLFFKASNSILLSRADRNRNFLLASDMTESEESKRIKLVIVIVIA
jgi:hypothetical protein